VTRHADVEDLLRPLAPQVLGVLVRRYGRFDLCEDAVQERYRADLERFQKTARPIKDYVDRLVAHNDQRQLTRLPTYEELNAAIELLEEMLNKYLVLLKATSVPSADPVHQHDWKAAFRVAWLRD